MQRKINQQEEAVLQIIRKSTTLFPDKEEYRKIDDAAVGWANRKRKTNPKLNVSDSMRLSADGQSPYASQKKAVRLLINDNEGNLTIETASPPASQEKKQRAAAAVSSQIDKSTAVEVKAEEISRSTKEEVIFESVKLPSIKSSRSEVKMDPIAERPSAVQPQRLQLKVHEIMSERDKRLAMTTKHGSMSGSSWARPARNILELEQKFQTVYVQSNSLSSTQRSLSTNHNLRMDQKIVNIMQRLNSRFNKDVHKQRNESIIERLRRKHTHERQMTQVNLPSSPDLIEVTGSESNEHAKFLVQAGSSGFIAEASQESLQENSSVGVINIETGRQSQDPLQPEYLDTSQKYLPKLRSIKAAEIYSRKHYLAESKPNIAAGMSGKRRVFIKTANLTPYNAAIFVNNSRQTQAQSKERISMSPWERTLPAVVSTRTQRKPITIDESVQVAQRRMRDHRDSMSATQETFGGYSQTSPQNQHRLSDRQTSSRSPDRHLSQYQQRQKGVNDLVSIYKRKIKEERHTYDASQSLITTVNQSPQVAKPEFQL